jgi:hypothetical protein
VCAQQCTKHNSPEEILGPPGSLELNNIKTTTLNFFAFHCTVVLPYIALELYYSSSSRDLMEVLLCGVQGTRSHALHEELRRRQIAEESRLLTAKLSSLANPICSG